MSIEVLLATNSGMTSTTVPCNCGGPMSDTWWMVGVSLLLLAGSVAAAVVTGRRRRSRLPEGNELVDGDAAEVGQPLRG